MTLSELKAKVDMAAERAREFGVTLDEIVVTLQIDGVSGGSLWTDKGVDLHYDNDTFASGCVIGAILEED